VPIDLLESGFSAHVTMAATMRSGVFYVVGDERLLNSNKYLVMSPRWGLDTKTD
jgi:hypothetical protein